MAISSSQVREGLEGQGIRPNRMTKGEITQTLDEKLGAGFHF
jgi:hypothetical protein